MELIEIAPQDIEAESFRIIEAEFEEQTGKKIENYSKEEFSVLQRVIHATGDFSLATDIVFQNNPVEVAIEAVKNGGHVITDVNMVASGVSAKLLGSYGGKVLCRVADRKTAALASKKNITRSDAAMRSFAGEKIAIAAIGNAPTALVSLLHLIEQGEISVSAVIGVPVGFVNAAESKEMLKLTSIPAITISGRRGGSPIAAAMVNAILRLVKKEKY